MRRAFPDHHRYTPRDFERLEKGADGCGAEVLVTTEKDAMNFGGLTLRSGVGLYWLKIGIEIHGESDLLRRLLEKESGKPV
jgi:tetraacyldisaccharide-1-P 4'-kinase